MRQLIASMKATGDMPPVAVMVDGPMYDIDWPAHWHVHNSLEHLEMQLGLNTLFKFHPDEPWYGIMADHARPKTPGWSKKLEAIAGSNRLALAHCGKDVIHPVSGKRRMNSPCIGGDLVRKIGWIWLPSVVHLYGDDALEDIAYGLDIVQYTHDVTILDLLKRDGEVPLDENHKRLWNGKHYAEHDRQVYTAWKRNKFPALMESLGALCSQ